MLVMGLIEQFEVHYLYLLFLQQNHLQSMVCRNPKQYIICCFLELMLRGPAASPIAILFEELPENKHPACWPNAILLDPDVLVHKASNPIAVLFDPVVLNFKAFRPIAVL